MKYVVVFFAGLLLAVSLPAQSIDAVINASEVEKIERVLASDAMEGRRTFSKGNEKAANFIATEFMKAGLKPGAGESYLQQFNMVRAKFIAASGTLNGMPLDSKNIVALTTTPVLQITELCGYEAVHVKATDTLFQIVRRLQAAKKNYFVTVDPGQMRAFNSLKGMRREQFESPYSIVFVLSDAPATSYTIEFKQEISLQPLQNVVGVLPGRSKAQEYVIFSAHYDHLGIGKPNEQGDSIYNGANDDAAGTTAVIMLARYYAQLKQNERTIIFVAFTAEEVGGFGAQYFSKQFNPDLVAAMFNIEMIGTESKWGRNAAYITGYEKSDMGAILQRNLKGSDFTFYPDPYTTQRLFYRSDNATLARLGVPAQTISTSRMEPDANAVNKTVDPYYHTLDDEVESLDMANMASIIKAIATSAVSILSGKDTPGRVVE